MAMHALELLPDAAGLAWVRQDWVALHRAGLSSQADHAGPTNSPHLTLVSAPALSERVERVAAEAFGPLLPVRALVGGVLLLGGLRFVLARHVEVEDVVLAACLRVRAAVGPPASQRRIGWTPHITLARRMPAEQVGRALEVLQPGGEQETTLELLRRWDPETGRVRQLVPRLGA